MSPMRAAALAGPTRRGLRRGRRPGRAGAGAAGARPSSVQPPAARDATRRPREFSAERAFEQVETIAAEPHAAGSAANDRVREHLVTHAARPRA